MISEQEFIDRVVKDLGKISFYFYVTYGLPFEAFKDEIKDVPFLNLVKSCLVFREEHPGILSNWKMEA